MKMSFNAAASAIIFIFISSTTIIAQAKIEQILASETRNGNAQQNAVTASESSQLVQHMDGISIDNEAEPDEHHRIVILVPQLAPPAHLQHAKKPKKKKPSQPPKKKPKVHHHHPNVVPVVHSGKVIHAHHHHGSVDHGHSHVAKAKHTHKHYGNANHKHGHYGVGRITHKHAATVQPSHKPKHLTAADIFHNNGVAAFRDQHAYPPLPPHQQYRHHPQYQHQQQQLQQHRYPQSPLPPQHLQHQQQVLHHRGFAPASSPNFFNNPSVSTSALDPYSLYGGIAAPAANRRPTAAARRDLSIASPPPLSPNMAQLIQIRRIPSSSSKEVLDSFIDKNTRSSLAAAALAFGNGNENGNENEYEEVNEAENENENENETENENEAENEKDEQESYVAVGGLERAVEEAAFAAIPRQKPNNLARAKWPSGAANAAVPLASEENFAALQLNSIDDDGGGPDENEASLHHATFVNPPPLLSPKNKIIAFSDAYHYQYR